MSTGGNIIVCDESALHLHLHCDMELLAPQNTAYADPLQECAHSLADLRTFNLENPLYGGTPIMLLVNEPGQRRHTDEIVCRAFTGQRPAHSFLRLREGLYVTCPELTFLRAALRLNENQLAEAGLNLCSRFFLNPYNGDICDRRSFATTPTALDDYLRSSSEIRGSGKALSALRWVVGNSGSPTESKMKLQFCNPLGKGGMNLPFTTMNYDVRAGKLAPIVEQGRYSVDLAAPKLKVGLEYDGELYHQDAGKDKRRRNELKALGWDIFPIDKQVLYNADATIRTAEQIAKYLGIRTRKPTCWESKFIQLRQDLALPI